jgi:hypothetical protein
MCSLYRFEKYHPDCPMYAFPESGHVNLFTPVAENLYGYGFYELNYLKWCYLCLNV